MPEPVKNMYNEQFFARLTASISRVYPAFDTGAFMAGIHDDHWDTREFKERMRHITLTLHCTLPNDYRTAIDILCRASYGTPDGLLGITLCDFVELYGLDDWVASLPALEQLTQLASAEFAVRPFIVKDQDRMMAQMLKWAHHEKDSVRRLASEGSRPRLPWGIALAAFKADPTPILPILEQLKCDESESVRRSVANNLNDIAKDNPQITLEVLRRWQVHDTPEMQALTRHALRTLIKQGNPDALALLGYRNGADVEVKNLTVSPAVIPMGNKVMFSFEVESLSDEPQDLVIDYVMYFPRANGKQSPKVFKLSQRTLKPGETIKISRQYDFKPITTRRYYPGEHAIQLQINGEQFERCSFMVE